jgi:hypothetical protein
VDTIYNRGEKTAIEMQKFQLLGEIAGLSQLALEIEESEEQGGLTSETLFGMIY